MSPLRIDRKSVTLMKEVGFDKIQIGFEALSDSTLRKLNKKQRFVHNIQALKLADEKNLQLIDSFILRDFPGETEEDIIESIKNLKFLRFQMQKIPLYILTITLLKRSPFYKEMSEEQRREWNKSYQWRDLNKLDFLSDIDRFEFCGFRGTKFENSYLWDVFKIILNQYQSKEFPYSWIEHPDGTSTFKERGTYIFDKTETEILKFCDTIKTKTQILNNFPNIKQDKIIDMLNSFKREGLMYFDGGYRQFITIPNFNHIKKEKV
jgi:hypothetical protein